MFSEPEPDKNIPSTDVFPSTIKVKKLEDGKNIELTYQNTYKVLGEGGFGKVYKFKLNNKDIVAGKIINEKKYSEISLLRDEINLQKSLNSSNIVKVIDYVEENGFIFIFLELCKNGSLKNLLKNRSHLTEKEVQCYMLQIIIALNYIHSNNIIHRDLKLGNILLGDNMEIKIGDFGLSTKLDRKSKKGLDKQVGTLDYEAPEILNKQNYFYEAEIWALGIIMCYLLTGKHPFSGKDEEELIQNIKDKPPVISPEYKISKAAEDLIKQILVKEPSKRPTLNQIIYHDFFNREGIPKYLGEETLNKAPEDFSDEILNKEVIMRDLISIVRPIINPKIKYEDINDINDIKKNNIKDIEIYVKTYLNYNERFGVGYILNNGDIGVYYRDKTILLLNIDKEKYLYIDKEEQKKIYNKDTIPELLNNKIKILNGFINYFKKHKKEDDNNLNENHKKENDVDIYVKCVIIDKKLIILKLSNDVEHNFFADKIEIIMSKNENKLTYIEKNRTKTNLNLNESFNNYCRDLHRRIKYIQYANVEFLTKEINKNYREQLIINDNNLISTEKDD